MLSHSTRREIFIDSRNQVDNAITRNRIISNLCNWKIFIFQQQRRSRFSPFSFHLAFLILIEHESDFNKIELKWRIDSWRIQKNFSRREFNSPSRKICSMNSERKAKWNKLKFYYQMAFRHEPAEIIWKWFMLPNRSTKRNKKYSLRTIYDNCMFRLLLCCWNGQLFEWQQLLYMESLFRLRPPVQTHKFLLAANTVHPFPFAIIDVYSETPR